VGYNNLQPEVILSQSEGRVEGSAIVFRDPPLQCESRRKILMPKAKSTIQRPQERDYSHRSLLDKLGVKPEHRISILGISDASFLEEVSSRSRSVSFDGAVRYPDMIFLAAETVDELSRLGSVARAIKGAAAIWVVYPKGQKHIREVDVISAGKAAGLVDNKVVRFSESHTALRFVVPLAMR
jgi:hypothetical protein